MNILDKIIAHKRTELRDLPEAKVSVDSLRAELAQLSPRRDFVGSLLKPAKGNLGLIAEVKKASPSKGVIRKDFDPVAIAIGLKPNNLCEIKRSTTTAITEYYYRLCY